MTYDSRISRNVSIADYHASRPQITPNFLSIINEEWKLEKGKDHMFFDTGFAGSIYNVAKPFISGKCLLASAMNRPTAPPQQYKCWKENQPVVENEIERWPKYHTSATIYCGEWERRIPAEVLQTENTPEEMIRALALTILLCQSRETFLRTQKEYIVVKETQPWWERAESVGPGTPRTSS